VTDPIPAINILLTPSSPDGDTRLGDQLNEDDSYCSSTPDANLLPPHEEVVEACKVFWGSYFQLGQDFQVRSTFPRLTPAGFLSKTLFLERLRNDFDSISKFLLLGILSISARFTPSLIRRYRGAPQATEVFVKRALESVPSIMYDATIENIQGLFLLSIAEWGNDEKDKSSVCRRRPQTRFGANFAGSRFTWELQSEVSWVGW
jgi:hypothetical protein